jgi:cobalamin biosynthesis protein CobT
MDKMEGVDGPVGEEDLIEEDARGRIETLLGEELRQEKIFIRTPDGRGCPPLYVRHPLETAQSRAQYIGKPKPVLARLRAALLFRQELPRFTNRLLRRGNLDEEELWRWGDGDYRVFNEEVIAARPQTQLSFLVDMSGSMYGQKLQTAQELSQLFIWALKDMDGVETKVFGHTGDVDSISIEIYRLWEPGEPLTRLGIINAMQHSQNYDGHAIAWCAKELMDRGQPEEQRILFVLSDGYPAAHGYGGAQGQEHVHQVTTWAEGQGVHVIQIAIDPSLDPARQARMFKEFIQFTNLDDVPKQLTRMLGKFV